MQGHLVPEVLGLEAAVGRRRAHLHVELGKVALPHVDEQVCRGGQLELVLDAADHLDLLAATMHTCKIKEGVVRVHMSCQTVSMGVGYEKCAAIGHAHLRLAVSSCQWCRAASR
eukprot:3791730-Pleurochrysis_carterae.AAC.1